MKTADNRKQIKRHIKRSTASNGFAILSVNPPAVFGDNPVNYSYTVGLHKAGLPELFICGPIPNNVMGAILKNQGKAWLRERRADLTVREDIVLSGDHKKMRSLTRLLHGEEAVTQYCVELRQRGGKGLQVAQVCYPDGANVLPGEEGYDTRYRQDVITVIPTPTPWTPDDRGPRGVTPPEPQCKAGDLKGVHNLGEHCPICDSTVVAPEYVYSGFDAAGL